MNVPHNQVPCVSVTTRSALILVVLASTTVGAMYMRVDVENVPVERLVTNLERMLVAQPNDARLHLNLARTHAMAWAQRTETVEAAKGYGAAKDSFDEPWFGYVPKAVPFQVAPVTDAERLKAAAPHLERALRHYVEAVRLAPDNLEALLGHAWLVEQSGDKTAAIPLYRVAIEHAWKSESVRRGLGGSVTAEGAGYLIPLLDPQRDRAEIATLRARVDQVSRMPRLITPLAVPLRDGMKIGDVVTPLASVPFDVDGSGERKTWSWITPDTGWLVYNQRPGPITSGLQLFGNVTFWLFWDNGYDALSALDDDGDGALAGRELTYLSIWRDANTNGISEPDEVRPVAEWGIRELSCKYEVAEDGIVAAWSPNGVTFTDGHSRPTWDVLLQQTAR